MPKIYKPRNLLIQNSINDKTIIINDNSFFCVKCYEYTNCDKKHLNTRIKRHLNLEKHNKNTNLQKNQTIDSTQIDSKTLSYNYGKALILDNIPFETALKPTSHLKQFIETTNQKNLLSTNTIRNNTLPLVYNKTINEIKNKIKNELLYFVIDETTKNKKSIVNILVGVLNGEQCKSMLYSTTELRESANAQNIQQTFENSLKILFENNIPYEKIVLILSDQASYMVKCFKTIKSTNLYPNLYHVTCLAHKLHNVCETIRSENNNVKNFVSNMDLLLKSLKFEKELKYFLNVTSIPKYCNVRWGTFLKTALFYNEHYNKLKDFIISSNVNNSYKTALLDIIENTDIENELINLKYFDFLPKFITLLESQSITRDEAIALIENSKAKLTGKALRQLTEAIDSNSDIYKFYSNKNENFMFAPMTSCDVERSFSILSLVVKNRPNLKTENLNKLLVCYYNNSKINIEFTENDYKKVLNDNNNLNNEHNYCNVNII